MSWLSDLLGIPSKADINALEIRMATKFSDAVDKLVARLTTFSEGFRALRAENAVLRDKVSGFDAATAQAVEDALAADDAADADAIDAAQSELDKLDAEGAPVVPAPAPEDVPTGDTPAGDTPADPAQGDTPA